jgi:hypothetical protein
MPSTHSGLLLMTGVSAGLGALTMANAATAAYAIILSLATGAPPAVIVKATLPEAQQPGLSTPAGGRPAVRFGRRGLTAMATSATPEDERRCSPWPFPSPRPSSRGTGGQGD